MVKRPENRLSARETQAFLQSGRFESAAASAFSFTESSPRLVYAAHKHTRHQLLYAVRGSACLRVAEATLLLPPQRAGFIPAGVEHVTAVGDATVISLFFDRSLVRLKSPEVQVIDVSPLLREMIQFATRWPATRRQADSLANAYFRAFGLLLEEWLEQKNAYRLPRGQSTLVKRAIELTVEHFGVIDLPEVCRVVGASPRSLRRHLQAETGLTFRELASTARVLRAMELLANGEHSVTDVALTVGFDSLSAFAKSFARIAGESPSAFRARARPVRT